MGHLLDGAWTDEEFLVELDDAGTYTKQPSKFRNWITADGSAAPMGEAGFKAEAGRYVLYAAVSCPWAHRAVLYRVLTVSYTHLTLPTKA